MVWYSQIYIYHWFNGDQQQHSEWDYSLADMNIHAEHECYIARLHSHGLNSSGVELHGQSRWGKEAAWNSATAVEQIGELFL